jgi:arabinofuranosyltransferase
LPAILWLSFSLIYYGFFFPNTYYAKLHTGISQILLLQQGLKYYLYTICFDPNTLLFILIAVVAAIFIKRDYVYLNAGLGIVLYLVYIVMIGGDFFGGRFFSVPFFLSSFLLIKLTNSKKFDLIVSIACIMIFPRKNGHTVRLL